MHLSVTSSAANTRLFLIIQWTAAAIALTGSFLVGCGQPHQRFWGFALFLVSNLLWMAWARKHAAWGLLAMQLAFCITSARGCYLNL